MKFCDLQLVIEFTVTGADAPDARWRLDLDSKSLTYKRRPNVNNPFKSLEPTVTSPQSIENPRQLFFSAGPARPVEFYDATTKHYFHLLPPDEGACHYWHSSEGAENCPSAPNCPYRSQIVRFQPVPNGTPLPENGIKLTGADEWPIESSEESEPPWNLFPLHDLGAERRCSIWVESRSRGLLSLPPVAVTTDETSFFASFASRLRQVLLSRRSESFRLRSDLLVSAIDQPGVREAGASGLLVSLDLRESFPAVRPVEATTIARTVIVRLCRPVLPNEPVSAWQRYYTPSNGGPEHLALTWLRRFLTDRLAGPSYSLEWQVDLRVPNHYSPIEPNPEHYTPEVASTDLGDSLAQLVVAISKEADADTMLLAFASEFRDVNSQNPKDPFTKELLTLAHSGVTEPVESRFVALLGYADTAPPREAVKASLFRKVLRWVPGHLLSPPRVNPWPGQLMEWWLSASPLTEHSAVGKTALEIAILVTSTAASQPVRVATSRLGQTSPRRFVLGHSRPEERINKSAGASTPVGPDGWGGIIAALTKEGI
jgi:hypothetical protein